MHLSWQVDMLAERAASAGCVQRAQELRQVASVLRAKAADVPPVPPKSRLFRLALPRSASGLLPGLSVRR